jgi:SagB-type dehydrogenase family enzyme
MVWHQYHEQTKHSPESLRRVPHTLDWSNMPYPFRHYEGAPILDLPEDPPDLSIPALQVLGGSFGTQNVATGAFLLSQLLFHSAGISASKIVPATGARYALRVNPSSGNLHPTEFHFRVRGLSQWPDGLYHYRPSAHVAEQRASGAFDFSSSASIVFVLTSIAWREAWKYRDRAYRYCLHDIGHAWQSIALAARAMGWDAFAIGHFSDDEIHAALQLADDELPMLLVELRGQLSSPAASGENVWHGGAPNPLSDEIIVYPKIHEIHAATKARKMQSAPGLSFGAVVRKRRSALDFVGGGRSITTEQLTDLLNAAQRPFSADFGASRFVQLYAFVHRIVGVEPGLYRVAKDAPELEKIKDGNQTVAAAGLSLGQDLAGNSCVTFSMIGDLGRATELYGDRGYRYVFFEAGAIGQRLYLGAEALGLGATGIGAFFDDRVHQYLGLSADAGQAVYHFAVGYPVPDPRLGE